MRKYSFFILALLMALVLTGLIVVQVNWIKNLLKTKEEIFKYEVIEAMQNVSHQLENKEIKALYTRFLDLTKNRRFAEEAAISNIVFEQIDTATHEKFTYKRKILEQKYKVPKDLLLKDSISEISRNYAKKDVMVSTQIIDEKQRTLQYKIIEHESNFRELTDLERNNLKDILIEQLKRTPIEQHVGIDELEYKIINELQKNGIFINFEFAVYKNDKVTSIKSENFDPYYPNIYTTSLFQGENKEALYQLYVYFPKKKNYLLSNIMKNLVLSIVFILFISGVFGMSLYLLNKHKKIDAIKTDFINNMTHEFKTPIATINLALDSILNPTVIENKERIRQYAEMIREENKRMNNQVENVLRVARLDKQEKIEMELLDMHEIIEEAISHIQLKIETRDGRIKTSLKALKHHIYGNAFHSINMLVNILDNAIKYTKQKPIIIVSTYNSNNYLFIHVKDNGIGISKKAQKHIFDKFYREETGNIHNTKGHGLGLAYVKRIVNLQHGEISVKSEEKQGTTFILKFPLNKKVGIINT